MEEDDWLPWRVTELAGREGWAGKCECGSQVKSEIEMVRSWEGKGGA
jgi:hypothetical protein